MKKYIKISCFKTSKNADILLFLQLFTTGQREKDIGKTLFMSADAQKM